MFSIIRHRMNLSSQLKEVNPEHGVEIDLRSVVGSQGELHLSHDPWVKGENFKDWLVAFTKNKIKGPILLNTKEDLLEEKIISTLSEFGITNYFFIDTALPTLVRHIRLGNGKKFSVRLSIHEPLSFVQNFQDKVDWVWADCFGRIPLDVKVLEEANKKFKICLVSPELHGAPDSEIAHFKHLAKLVDSVCTKYPDAWL